MPPAVSPAVLFCITILDMVKLSEDDKRNPPASSLA